MSDETILERGGTEEDIRKYAEQNGADLTEKDVYIEELFNTFVAIVDEKGDGAGKEYLCNILLKNVELPDQDKRSRLLTAIQKNEPIYLSEYGYALSEEDYCNFEEFVECVGKPEGSTSEKFTRYISGIYEE